MDSANAVVVVVLVLLWLAIAVFSALARVIQKMPQDLINSLFVAPFNWLSVAFGFLGVVAERVVKYLRSRFAKKDAQ